MEALSSCVRPMIKAPKGKHFIVADYSSIEARILAVLAHQKDIVEIFKTSGKVYEYTASRLFRKPIETINKEERFIGKIATLALGYQGGAAAFKRIANNYDVDFSEQHAELIKVEWRGTNVDIKRFWGAVEHAAKEAVLTPGRMTSTKAIKFKVMNTGLCCRLPSSRLITYNQPRMLPGKFGNPQVSFIGVDSKTKKWQRQSGYGGLFVENICQGIARDIMAHAMINLEAAGYTIVMTVHDEIIAEVDNGFGNVEEFEQIMCDLPKWAYALPIKAEGFECQRYQKS